MDSDGRRSDEVSAFLMVSGLVVPFVVRLGWMLCDLTLFFFNDTATTEIYTLSLHDALPICNPLCAGSSDPRCVSK